VLVVAFDTATPACGVALVDLGGDGAAGACGAVRVLAEETGVPAAGAARHGEVLAPAIARVLAAGGVRPGDLGAVAVGAGPGPFTGLRVGVVTAAALADALGVPAYTVCSLDAVAWAGAARPPGGLVAVATDARRREVYWAVYRDGTRIAGPAVGLPADVAARLRAQGVTRLTGAGATRYAEVVGDLLDPAGPQVPSPSALAALVAAKARAGAPSDPLTPLYLRRPDVAEPHAPKPVTAAAGAAP
jgi:tRNA threonylcarbamoyl adenosine modification protein YeaZ